MNSKQKKLKHFVNFPGKHLCENPICVRSCNFAKKETEVGIFKVIKLNLSVQLFYNFVL